MNNLLNEARDLPMRDPVQTLSISPVVLGVDGRPVPLALRVTAPSHARALPVVLLSHGDGPSFYLSSKDGYAPLAGFLAEQGFAVIQPTHGNSKVDGFDRTLPGAPLFWRSRVADMKAVLDQLDEVERLTPTLAGRLNRSRVAAIGHSLGGQTTALLLGARLTDPNDPEAAAFDGAEPRIRAGVLLAAPGRGGAELSDFARERFSFMNPDYTTLTVPTLVVVGDADVNPYITTRGPEWYAAAFEDAPGAQWLLTLHGGGHGLGGIAGWDAKETGDENPDRLAATLRLTAAYLRSALYEGDPAWAEARAALSSMASSLGHVAERQA